MTVDKVVINLDRTFSPGQAYVALSRVTSKEGLFIETNDPQLLNKKIYADPEVKLALQEMPKLTLPIFETFIEGISIFLHNIQSLHKHFDDLVKDRRCWNADILCLTETWMRSGQNVSRFEINGFKFHSVAREDAYDDSNTHALQLQSSKGGGVAVYVKETGLEKRVFLLPEKNLEGISVEFDSKDIAVLTLYRPNILSVNQFLLQLEKVIAHYKSLKKELICLGDFNEHARSPGPIQNFMKKKGFMQKVDFSTTGGATTLDHVYLSTSLQATVEKLPTYYSYHDAVMVKINIQT